MMFIGLEERLEPAWEALIAAYEATSDIRHWLRSSVLTLPLRLSGSSGSLGRDLRIDAGGERRGRSRDGFGISSIGGGFVWEHYTVDFEIDWERREANHQWIIMF